LKWCVSTAALERGDILWDKAGIFLQRAWCEETGRVDGLKNRLNRVVPMPRALVAMLREHLEIIDLEGMRLDWTDEQRRLVFPGPHGTIIRHSTLAIPSTSLPARTRGSPPRPSTAEVASRHRDLDFDLPDFQDEWQAVSQARLNAGADRLLKVGECLFGRSALREATRKGRAFGDDPTGLHHARA
jgi:hypothetical protein